MNTSKLISSQLILFDCIEPTKSCPLAKSGAVLKYNLL